jgi:hypothetical protein
VKIRISAAVNYCCIIFIAINFMEQQYIPSIFNYCDRWCERCIFTSRCSNYESASKLKPEELDSNNLAFWKNVSKNFTTAITMLHKAAQQQGIELTMTVAERAAFDKKLKKQDKAIKNNELIKWVRLYQKTAMPFIDKSDGMVEKVRALHQHLKMGMVHEEDMVHTVAAMGNCFNILQWYLFFIDIKLQRALKGKMNDEEDDDYPKDSDGSAKIAIIATDKCIAAWAKLYELMSDCEDVSLQSLSLLSKIKERALLEFPVAMNFKRPGFDDLG